MWSRVITERLIVDTTDLAFNPRDKIVSVRLRNIGDTGAATILTGWNSENAPNPIEPGDSDSFDAGDNGILAGQLKVTFSGSGEKRGLLLIVRNGEEICD